MHGGLKKMAWFTRMDSLPRCSFCFSIPLFDTLNILLSLLPMHQVSSVEINTSVFLDAPLLLLIFRVGVRPWCDRHFPFTFGRFFFESLFPVSSSCTYLILRGHSLSLSYVCSFLEFDDCTFHPRAIRHLLSSWQLDNTHTLKGSVSYLSCGTFVQMLLPLILWSRSDALLVVWWHPFAWKLLMCSSFQCSSAELD